MNLEKRRNDHFNKLRKGTHGNRHLQRSWDKYGADAFVFAPIVYCAAQHLNALEDCLIANNKDGYNILPTSGMSHLGIKPSEETRRKMSEARKGRKYSKEICRKISEALRGKQRSKDHCRKISEAKKGHSQGKLSKDHCRKISEALKGHSFSEETRRKIGEASKGRKASEETRRKMSESHAARRAASQED